MGKETEGESDSESTILKPHRKLFASLFSLPTLSPVLISCLGAYIASGLVVQVSGATAGVISFFIDINILAEMISMGTLMAFSLVCGGIIVLRVHHPTHTQRPLHLLLLFVLFSIGTAPT